MIGAPISAVSPTTGQAVTPVSTFFGLPVIGFAAANYVNTALKIDNVTYFANWAVEFDHRYQRRGQ
jgi:hypothetical protein